MIVKFDYQLPLVGFAIGVYAVIGLAVSGHPVAAALTTIPTAANAVLYMHFRRVFDQRRAAKKSNGAL